ncbi:TetR family transcriptional regulator [Actinomadura sp. ATCC 31491]|uniref:TetR family transcriptional regulator n=1 Tax=Actinomadura luzonensis TaxID=2805427 RepID=A0ABT0G2T2_9ACTN|nr:TetR family transcriptional regulator [Actinomadura luzonensis]MCK2218490.1 TetR family transcriptional regulator [Actinomadura luzonensis]
MTAETGRRRAGGRRPGASGTREAILAAAQRSFAEHGYTATTVRGVASAAGVDPALVLQFYGSKDQLFDAALRADPPTRPLAALVREGGVADLGERLTRRYLELWEAPDTGARLLAVVRGASASPSASAMVAAFMSDEVMLPLARAIGADQAELRANLTGAHLLGVATARYVLRVEPLASLERERLVALLAPVVQRFLTGEPA